VIAEGLERGFGTLSLDVASGNDGAIRFYRRAGFLDRSEQRVPPGRGLPGMASIRMELPLSPQIQK
jgi:ribosomal protein S18 acetylase RimI-like enzyme